MTMTLVTISLLLLAVTQVLTLGFLMYLSKKFWSQTETQQSLHLALSRIVEALKGAVRKDLGALDEKFMGAFKRGMEAQNAIHASQGDMFLDYAARLAAIETLLNHARAKWGAQLQKLYQQAKAHYTAPPTVPAGAVNDAGPVVTPVVTVRREDGTAEVVEGHEGFRAITDDPDDMLPPVSAGPDDEATIDETEVLLRGATGR